MKKQFKAFALGAATATLLSGVIVSSLAISGQMTITVDPINIQVNGEVFQPKDSTGKDVPVFQFDGTTYAPLRALAEAYGLEVGYNAELNLATVVDPDANSSKTENGLPEAINQDGKVSLYKVDNTPILANGKEVIGEKPAAVIYGGADFINVNLLLRSIGLEEVSNQYIFESLKSLSDANNYIPNKYLIIDDTVYTYGVYIAKEFGLHLSFDFDAKAICFTNGT